MARRRKATPASPQGRDLARAIRQGERAGLPQRDIAAALGINERTVRKIKSGQTTGTRTYARLTKAPRKVTLAGAFNAEFTVGYDKDGNPVFASANLIVADVRTKEGGRRAPTALDVFTVPNLSDVIDAERERLARRYGIDVVSGRSARVPRLRKIGTMRKPAAAILRTGGAR